MKILFTLIIVTIFLKGMAIIGEEIISFKSSTAVEDMKRHNPNEAAKLWDSFAKN